MFFSRCAKRRRTPTATAAFVRVQPSRYINPTWHLRWSWPRRYVPARRTESETPKWSHFRGNRSVSQSATYRARAVVNAATAAACCNLLRVHERRRAV